MKQTLYKTLLWSLITSIFVLIGLWCFIRYIPDPGNLVYLSCLSYLEKLEKFGLPTLERSPDGWPVATAFGNILFCLTIFILTLISVSLIQLLKGRTSSSRYLIFLVCFTIPIGPLYGGGPEPIPRTELAEFLGPLSPKSFDWTKTKGPDFDVFYGQAKLPLSGRVGFYLGGHPSAETESGSASVKGHLGVHSIVWQKTIKADGSIRQRGLVQLDSYLRCDIWIEGKTQADIDGLVAAVSQLPVFTKNR